MKTDFILLYSRKKFATILAGKSRSRTNVIVVETDIFK
jgi:hypothetical protein